MTPMPATAAVRVRRAELSDLDDLVALEEHSFATDRLSRAQYRRHLDSETAQVLVASANHRRFLGTAGGGRGGGRRGNRRYRGGGRGRGPVTGGAGLAGLVGGKAGGDGLGGHRVSLHRTAKAKILR